MRDRYGDVVRFVPEPPSQQTPQGPLPNQIPSPDTDHPPHPRFSPELRKVSNHAFNIPSTNGWQTGLTHRRLSAPNERQPCSLCGKLAVPEMDFVSLQAFLNCPTCGTDTPAPSYLQYELHRKTEDPIISDHQGYIADDPLLAEEPLWENGIFHLGAPMGSGKTTLIYQRAREAAESGACTIIIVPRRSLAEAAHAELAQQQLSPSQWLPLSEIQIAQEAHAELGRSDTTLWTLFHEGSEKTKPKKERWKIGEIGSVATLGMMPHLIEKALTHSERPVRFFFDEIDFMESLRLSDIFKTQSDEIKQILKDAAHQYGIVTAGQTASALALEAIAKELSVPLKSYYTAPQPLKRTAALYVVNSHSVDKPKNRLQQVVIDHIHKLINNTNKNIYIHADERGFCGVVQKLFPNLTVIYDAYHRDSPKSKDVLWRKRLPDDKRIFVSSNAVDVGISIEDSHAETIVVSLSNTLHIGNLESVVQRCMRNRQKPPLSIYHLKHQNPLPIAPSQAADYHKASISRLMDDDETAQEGLADTLGIEFGMRSLADNEPETFIQHHLEIAGFSTEVVPIDLKAVDYKQVKELRKSIRLEESEKVMNRATELLTPETLLMESEIRQRTWEESQPAPINRLAHERANTTMRMCGWTGHVEREVTSTIEADPFEAKGVTAEMWRTAKQAVSLDSDKVKKWKIGFVGVHHTEALHREKNSESTLHHRRDDRPLALLVKSLLECLPREPAPKEAIGQALISAAQVRYGPQRLSEMLKDGSISPEIAKQVRFISLGKDAEPAEKHFDLAKKLISDYYPARIAKTEEKYQLAAPKDTGQVELFKQVVKCYIKHRHPDIDPDDPDNSNLPPPPASGAFKEEKDTAREMRSQGKSIREIQDKINMSVGWISKVTSDLSVHANSNKGPLTEITVNTCGLSESLPSHAPTAFEADSAKVTSESNITLRKQILETLRAGEKQTKELIERVEGHPVAIKTELKRLVDAGEIQKPRRGRYILANTSAQAIPSETDTPAVTNRIIIDRGATQAFRRAFPKTPMITTRSRTSDSEHWDELPAVAFIDKDDFLSGIGELDWTPVVYDSSYGVWRKTEWDEQLENPPAVFVRKPLDPYVAEKLAEWAEGRN